LVVIGHDRRDVLPRVERHGMLFLLYEILLLVNHVAYKLMDIQILEVG